MLVHEPKLSKDAHKSMTDSMYLTVITNWRNNGFVRVLVQCAQEDLADAGMYHLSEGVGLKW